MYRREITTPAADQKALTRKFLIANPLLEFPLTYSKQSPLTFSNREYIAVFQFKSFSLLAPLFSPRRPSICRANFDPSTRPCAALLILTTLSGYGIYPPRSCSSVSEPSPAIHMRVKRVPALVAIVPTFPAPARAPRLACGSGSRRSGSACRPNSALAAEVTQ
jgi:hypothetical protein